MKLLAVALVAFASVSADGMVPRILDGKPSNWQQFPYIVSIRHDKRHICAGTIISPNLILTAASCVPDNIKVQDLTVFSNTLTIQSDEGDINYVRDILKHPQYDRTLGSYNAALLVLKNDLFSILNLGEKKDIDFKSDSSSPEMIAAGWGRSKKLQYETLKINKIPNDVCETNDNFLCLTAPDGSVFCKGDDGGPVVDVTAKRDILVGIITNEFKNCSSNNIDRITKVNPLRDWISSQMTLAERIRSGINYIFGI